MSSDRSQFTLFLVLPKILPIQVVHCAWTRKTISWTIKAKALSTGENFGAFTKSRGDRGMVVWSQEGDQGQTRQIGPAISHHFFFWSARSSQGERLPTILRSSNTSS
jgi:hypothetical protein